MRVAPRYFPGRPNVEPYSTAYNARSLLFNRDIPPAALPAPLLCQEWRNPLQSMGQDQPDPTRAVLDAIPNMGSSDTRLTQVPCVPGPVDDCLTWPRPIDPSPHLDYSIEYVSLLIYIMSVYASHGVHILYLGFPPLTNGLTGVSRKDTP